MGESGCYNFRDLRSQVEVQLQIAPTLATSDIHVQATADSLRITERGSSAVLLNVTQLYSTVSAAATEHTAKNGNLTVTLQKLDQKLSWPAFEVQSKAHANGTEDAESGNQTSRAMQEREKVKALLTAAQSGSVADVQQAAEQFGQDSLAEVKDGTGKNCLHFAAQTGQTDVCKYLLTELHFNPDEQEEAGETALTLAAGSGETETVALLLKQNATVSKCRPGGAQPIHTAAASGNVATLKLLLQHGGDPNAAADAGPPVMWAAGSGKAATLEALLAAGANPDVPGNSNVTAILAASAAGNVEAVKSLVAAHADVTIPAEHGVTALHAAAELGNMELVQLLLQAGADPNAEDGGGQKAIHAAAAEQHRDIVELLLPKTSPDSDNASNWTADGVIEEAQQSIADDQPHTQQPQESKPGLSHMYQHSSTAVTGSGVQTRTGTYQPDTAVNCLEIQIPAPEQPDEAAAADHKRKGDIAFVAKQYQQALQAYSQCLKHSTSNHVVWANRSAVLLRLDKHQAALEDARRARTIDETYPKAWFREGCAARELELYEDAAQAFFEAYRLDSSNPQLAQAFQEAIKLGQKQYQQQQKT